MFLHKGFRNLAKLSQVRRFSSFEPVRISASDLTTLQSLPEYQAFESKFHSQDYNSATTKLEECLKILESAGQENTLSTQHILKQLGSTHFHNFQFDQSEKFFLRSANLVPKIFPGGNYGNQFLESQNLCFLYFHAEVEMAKNYADGEIQAIFDAKKDYYQDENYFKWLDATPQPRWSFLKGTALALQQEFKEADKALRICLGKETNLVRESHILNNLAFNTWRNKEDLTAEDKNIIKQRFIKAILNFIEDQNMKDILVEDADWKSKSSNETIQDAFLRLEVNHTDRALAVAMVNLSEFLMETSEDITQDTSFWAILTLKYLESRCVFDQRVQTLLPKHLCTMAQLYAHKNKYMMGEGLFRQAIDMIAQKPTNVYSPGNLAHAKHLYGMMLQKVPKRESEGENIVSEADEILASMTYTKKIEEICIPQFNIDI